MRWIAGLAVALAVPAGAWAQAGRTEVVREVFPEVGRQVVASTPRGPVATIEWRQRVEVRARTATGAALSPQARAEALGRALATCRRGEPRGAVEVVEFNGTYVVGLDCVRLQ
ncbi:hypothetical protein [Rubellimicrobium aerolatum]|uniref:Uncharacterized protein n=1 Tax=Rubellimicrobium aerolatum TaxID=490979 RepID=A0ABW0SBJ3_9RHOB|nr:hypothetical protein [Rubellimicrobium aerolatum]MBP1805879.1 hypothetical protein [Rubellimicrobium aerolatum]